MGDKDGDGKISKEESNDIPHSVQRSWKYYNRINPDDIGKDSENRYKVIRFCEDTWKHLESVILEKAISFKGRLGSFNWERFLCVKQVGACVHEDKRIQPDDEDGEREEGDDEGEEL